MSSCKFCYSSSRSTQRLFQKNRVQNSKLFTRIYCVSETLSKRTKLQKRNQGVSKQPKLQPDNSYKIQNQLGECQNVDNIISVLRNHEDELSHVNLSKACKILSQLYRDEDQELLQETANFLVDKFFSMQPADAFTSAMVMQTLGKLHYEADDGFIIRIYNYLNSCISKFSAQGCVMVLHGFASMREMRQIGGVADQICELFLNRFIQVKSEWQPQFISQFVWALGKLKFKFNPNQRKIFQDEIYPRIQNKEFTEQNLNMMLVGYANMDCRGHEDGCPGRISSGLLKLFKLKNQNSEDANLRKNRGQKSPQIDQFPIQAYSNSLWSLAKMHINYQKFTDYVCGQIVKKNLADFGEQELSNIVWALSEFVHFEFELTRPMIDVFLYLMEAIIKKSETFTPQGLSNVSLAYARVFSKESLCVHGIDLYRALNIQIQKRIKKFTTQNLSNSIWSFSVVSSIIVRIYDDELFELFASEICRRIDEVIPKDVASVLNGFGRCGYRNEKALNILSNYVAKNIDQFSTQEVVNSYFGLANIQFFNEDLMHAFQKRILNSEVLDWDPQALSNCLWAFSVQEGNYNEEVFVKLAQYINYFQEARSTEDIRAQSPQIYQSFLLCKLNYDTKWWKCLQPGLRKQCANMWKSSVVQFSSQEPSDFQQTVYEILGDLGIKQREMEYITEGELSSIDIAFVVGGQKIAIEVDGPSHFTLSQPYLPLAKTVARNTLLEGLGWHVHSIPWYHWQSTKPEMQRKYVKQSVGKFLMQLREQQSQ